MLLQAAAPLTRAETVPAARRAGRVLDQSVIAEVSLPGFARSVMDGFACGARHAGCR